jgi:hypothetical protein
MSGFYSAYGGLWCDRLDPSATMQTLTTVADPDLMAGVSAFIRQGYVVFRRAIGHAAIDQYLREFEAAADVPGFLRLEHTTSFSWDQARVPGAKVLDTGMLLPKGQALCFAPAIVKFLEVMFQEKALAFQTLHFEVGSTQAVHQDTAYVVVDREPMKLIAAWIALEDVQPGTGELIYYPGGHRIQEYLYHGGKSKSWDPVRDGHPAHDAHLSFLHQECGRSGLKLEKFLPKKGDVLLWHADLPHGGNEITVPGATRRSLVVHYTGISNQPAYVHHIPEDWRRKSPAADGHAVMSLYFPPSRFAASAGTADNDDGQTEKGPTMDRPMNITAVPDHGGDWYIEVIRKLHRILQPATYLEIGTLNGETLELAHCKSIAVDPAFELDRNVLVGKPVCHFFQTTSEEFFATHNPSAYLGASIELAFLDGLHHYEVLLNDFFQTEKHCKPDSVVLLHDCIPTDLHVARRDRSDLSQAALSQHADWWAGDVWKTLMLLRTLRPDLRICAFDAPPTGLVAITNLNPTGASYSHRVTELVAAYSDVSLHAYGLAAFHNELAISGTGRIMSATSRDEIFR